jgi:hypothetical protein
LSKDEWILTAGDVLESTVCEQPKREKIKPMIIIVLILIAPYSVRERMSPALASTPFYPEVGYQMKPPEIFQ